jgi:hypothetical protein
MKQTDTHHYYSCITGRENLLITIGDSYTAGVGVYTSEQVQDYKAGKKTVSDLFAETVRTCGAGSYPAHLAELMDCDLLNLGIGGGSNSASIKRLINHYDYNYIEQYKNVVVVWLLSDPCRISFYSNEQLISYIGNNDLVRLAYIKEVLKSDLDAELETKFYLQTAFYFCKAKEYKFFYGTAFYNISSFNQIINYPSSNLNNMLGIEQFATLLPNECISLCGHPDTHGYKIIAERIYSAIKKRQRK